MTLLSAYTLRFLNQLEEQEFLETERKICDYRILNFWIFGIVIILILDLSYLDNDNSLTISRIVFDFICLFITVLLLFLTKKPNLTSSSNVLNFLKFSCLTSSSIIIIIHFYSAFCIGMLILFSSFGLNIPFRFNLWIGFPMHIIVIFIRYFFYQQMLLDATTGRDLFQIIFSQDVLPILFSLLCLVACYKQEYWQRYGFLQDFSGYATELESLKKALEIAAEEANTNEIQLEIERGRADLLTSASVLKFIQNQKLKSNFSIQEHMQSLLIPFNKVIINEKIGMGSVGEVYRGYLSPNGGLTSQLLASNTTAVRQNYSNSTDIQRGVTKERLNSTFLSGATSTNSSNMFSPSPAFGNGRKTLRNSSPVLQQRLQQQLINKKSTEMLQKDSIEIKSQQQDIETGNIIDQQLLLDGSNNGVGVQETRALSNSVVVATTTMTSGEKQEFQMIAIKRIPKSRINRSQVSAILQEVMILSMCKHPNIVQIVGFIESPYLCIVSEYMQLGTLKHWLVGNYPKFSVGWNHMKTRLTIDAAAGVAFLHSHSIIHRDLKAENFLVNSRGVVKVADLGTAAFWHKEESKRMSCVGTPIYVAPEVIKSESGRYDEKADVYSFGLVLCEILTHSQPYTDKQGNSFFNLIQVVEKDLSPLKQLEIFFPQQQSTITEIDPAYNIKVGEWMPEPEKESETGTINTASMKKLRKTPRNNNKFKNKYRSENLNIDLPEIILHLVMDCVSFDPQSRPTMKQVLFNLFEACLFDDEDDIDQNNPGMENSINNNISNRSNHHRSQTATDFPFSTNTLINNHGHGLQNQQEQQRPPSPEINVAIRRASSLNLSDRQQQSLLLLNNNLGSGSGSMLTCTDKSGTILNEGQVPPPSPPARVLSTSGITPKPTPIKLRSGLQTPSSRRKLSLERPNLEFRDFLSLDENISASQQQQQHRRQASSSSLSFSSSIVDI